MVEVRADDSGQAIDTELIDKKISLIKLFRIAQLQVLGQLQLTSDVTGPIRKHYSIVLTVSVWLLYHLDSRILCRYCSRCSWKI